MPYLRSAHLLCVLAAVAACSGTDPATVDAGRIMAPRDAAAADAPVAAADAPVAVPDAPVTVPDAAVADASPPPPDAGSSTVPTPLPGDPALCPSGYRTQLGAGQHTGFAAGGQSRSFHLLLPPASFTGPRPLLVAFHGTGMSGALAISSYGLQSWADAGFVVVAPDSNGNGAYWPVWDALELPGAPAHANADLALFDDLVQCVAGHHALDAKRIYVAGHSAGGIMTNFLLGRRASLLAGGIPASGVIDLTQTNAVSPIDPIFVIVTWGGTNDRYTGSAGGTFVENIGFVEQAALASQHWEAQPGSDQVACHGDDLGHVWLTALNGWMREVLLAHPKGAAEAPSPLPSLPAGAHASCSEAAAVYTSPITVSCPASSAPGCRPYCQLLGDCLAENGSLAPIFADVLQAVGFADTANVCSSCVSRCEEDAAGSAADATVLGCFASDGPATACGPGFAGAAALPTIATCCARASGSHVCARFCAAYRDSAMSSVLPICP